MRPDEPPDEPFEPVDDTLIEFLVEFASDRGAGVERPLHEYLQRFPGAERRVAEAYAELLDAPPDAAPADALELGPYRLLNELGRGGQAVVWLAEDTRIGRRVALKVSPRSPGAADLTPRLRREALAAARVNHPSLCPIFDVGADETRAWLAMRYVEGETLERRMARGAVDSVEQRSTWIEGVARALHAAHDAGVVHRDVKPGNVMIQPGGEPVVLDFGIARAEDFAAPLTRTGDAAGTPAYMAPEQVRGEPIDRRTDVWSLGVTAFELFTGRRPFEAPTREMLVRAILEHEPPSARALEPRVPRDLAVVLATALEKTPARRYQSCLDFAEDLRRARQREPILARPASTALKLRRWAERNRRLAASLAALMVVLITALTATTVLLRRTERALARRDALVRDVAQLSDQTLASDLLDEAPALLPAVEAMASALEGWLLRADGLLARRSSHEAAREQLAVRADFHPDPLENAAAREWFVTQLDRLLESLARVEATRAEVAQRLEFARGLRSRTVDRYAAQWSEAAARVLADPRFLGFALRPQPGFVPLGPDPRSKLEEFAHLASGAVPQRDERGELRLDDAISIVLVLVPPAEFTLGCELPSPSAPEGSPNVDRWRGTWDGPLRQVALDPFLIGKHELTRGQFERHGGVDPSSLSPTDELSRAALGRLAVETVSWDSVSRWLREMDLELPTEAQWEWAARAGTTSVFYTGDEVASLQGHANVADRTASLSGANWPCELALDDGFVAVAPVGSFAPNPFGLHDVYGNVMEWCRDSWEDLAKVEARPGDGLFVGSESTRVQRGGSFSHSPTACRSASRNGSMPSYVAPVWGARAARRLD